MAWFVLLTCVIYSPHGRDAADTISERPIGLQSVNFHTGVRYGTPPSSSPSVAVAAEASVNTRTSHSGDINADKLSDR